MAKAYETTLFIDESGVFDVENSGERPDDFPCQLAGILVPPDFSEADGEEILADALRAAGTPLERQFHAKDYRQRRPSAYSPAVVELSRQLRRRGVRCLRLVNEERVSWADRVSTYTNMVAELVLRCFRRLEREGHRAVRLHLHAGEWWMPEVHEKLSTEQYRESIRDALVLARLRSGVDERERDWQLGEVSLGDARKERRLQICDFLSHASSAGYRPCDEAATAALQAAFGEYDQTLSAPSVIDDLDGMLQRRYFGLAMSRLAEVASSSQFSSSTREVAETRRGRLAEGLAGTAPRARGEQLRGALAWLHELIEGQRALDLAATVGADFRKTLLALLEALPSERHSEIDWVKYSLGSLELLCANHRGDLHHAARLRGELDELLPKVASRWEHAPLVLESLVFRAVSEIDAFALSAASDNMSKAVKYYDELDGFFHQAYPGVFPEEMRSDLRARALGTAVQAEVARSLADPERLDEARRLADRALADFDSPADVARQHQYRAHLEAVARDFSAARVHLAQGIGAAGPEHSALALRVLELEGFAQGFAALHWLRLGALAICAEDDMEASAFRAAVSMSGVLEAGWCQGAPMVYPAHGILRRVALFHAESGNVGATAAALKRLCRTDEIAAGRLALVPIQVAAIVEAAGALLAHEPKVARKLLLVGGQKHASAVSLARSYLAAVDGIPSLHSTFRGWPAQIEEAAGTTDVPAGRKQLLGLARVVPH